MLLRRPRPRVRNIVSKMLVGPWNGAGTYVAGLGLDAGDGEDTFLLLDLVAVFPIDILASFSVKVSLNPSKRRRRTAASTWACKARLVSLSIVLAISPETWSEAGHRRIPRD